MSFKNRRLKNYLLFPKIQLTLLFSGLFVSAMSFGILWYKISATFSHLTSVGVQLNFRPESGYFKLLNSQQDLIYQNLLMVAVIGAFLSGIFLLVVSHRIVGPIYRLQKFLTELQAAKKSGGPLPTLKFRQGDYFSELADSINDSLK